MKKLEKIGENGVKWLSQTPQIYTTDENSSIELKGYTCYNFYRKFKHKRAKRNTGGMVVYVKHCLNRGTEICRNHFDTLIWIKTQKTFFDFDKDFLLCGVYAWPDESPAGKFYNVSLFDILQEDVFYYSQKGNVILAGDFNARVGLKPDFIVCDKKCADIDDIDYIPDQPISRTSQDNVCNARGSLLLDLCKSAGILLAN